MIDNKAFALFVPPNDPHNKQRLIFDFSKKQK